MKSSSVFADRTPVETGKTILLVDDVKEGTVARKTVLLGLGYTVETAECGSEALDLIAVRKFDVIVTDYKMPGMDGIELIGHARKLYPGSKIILLSALADFLGITPEHSGADVVLSKCAGELSQLTRAISTLLAKKPVRKPVGSEKKKPPLFMVKGS